MGGLAVLARELGHEVSGHDRDIYPPMSTQLETLGISLSKGYELDALRVDVDPGSIIIGNALSRGMPVIEAMLNRRLPLVSGPQWLAQHVLQKRQVLAVAGTHGKTTTTSMLAWILEASGADPGFLVGGVPRNFGVSARLGTGKSFVLEADEYDCAFFDKRSKFIHYRPEIAILNNLEFDHADIFDRLEDIERQFHHLIRVMPSQGRLIVNGKDQTLARVLARGCYTPAERFGIIYSSSQAKDFDWCALPIETNGFDLYQSEVRVCSVRTQMVGEHNMNNALAAIAAAHAAGVEVHTAAAALVGFLSPKRRLELILENERVRVFDDFAHHPTAISVTLKALQQDSKGRPMIVALEPRSNTMRMGSMTTELPEALKLAEEVHVLQRPELKWNPQEALAALGTRLVVHHGIEDLKEALLASMTRPCDVVMMSNGNFEGLRERLIASFKG
jgi:UDP-N-acetylmuramate: L-alanyl-gamma-D-glutamyl-meso-diaminopimelate ligase